MLVGRRSAEPSGISAARRSLALPVVSIKCSPILRVLPKQIAGREFLAGPRVNSIHLGHEFFQTIVFRVTQWAAAKSRKPGAEDHAVIGVFRCCDHLLFQAAGGFVDHEKSEPVLEVDTVILSGA